MRLFEIDKTTNFTVKCLGRNLYTYTDHWIMKFELSNYQISDNCGSYKFRKITADEVFLLEVGDFSISLMKSYFKHQCEMFDIFVMFNKYDERIGYIGVMYRGENEVQYKVRNCDALIFDVCIFKNYRGNGCCGLMLSCISDYLHRRGIKDVCLGVRKNNLFAIKAYKKFGFNTCGERKFVRILRINIPYCCA